MGSLLAQDWFVIPVFGILVFIMAYLWSDRIIAWLYNRSLGQRAEVVRLLEAMFVDVNERRVTAIMLLVSFGFGFVVFLLCWPNLLLGFVMLTVVSGFVLSSPGLAEQL